MRAAHGEAVGRDAVRFERLLPGGNERVWSYLIDSERRATWLAAGEMELRVGGAVTLLFRHAELSPVREPTPERYARYEEGDEVHGRITKLEPPRLLAHTWGEGSRPPSEVVFELTPEGDEVRLVVTQRGLADRAMQVNVASGWHTHLDILAERLRGREPRPFWSAHERLEREYEARLPHPKEERP